MTQPEETQALLDALLGPMAERLRDVNLPLHILLEGRFGELNDNQLEMIHAAQDAARAADRVLRDVKRLLALRNRTPALGRDVVRVDDLLRASLLVALAAAEDVGCTLEVDVPLQLPYARVDRGSVEEAMTTVLVHAVREHPTSTVRVKGSITASGLVIAVAPWTTAESPDLAVSLAEALLCDCRCRMAASAEGLLVTMPDDSRANMDL